MALPRGNGEQVTFKRSIEVVIPMYVLVSNDSDHNNLNIVYGWLFRAQISLYIANIMLCFVIVK